MKELYGIDMEETQHSKLISDIPDPDIAISMGCNVVCSMACPCTAIMPMVVEQYGECGEEKASDITLLTTFFAMGALPLSIWLSEILF